MPTPKKIAAAFVAALVAILAVAAVMSPFASAAASGNTLLHQLAESNDLAGLRAAPTSPAAVNARNRNGETPLLLGILANFGGAAGAARLLLERGADPNIPDASGTTPLAAAAAAGGDDLVLILTEGGALARGLPADWLLSGIPNLRAETVGRLLDDGAPLNFDRLSELGQNPIHLAAIGNAPGLIRRFIAAADASHFRLRDNAGRTPFDHALEGRRREAAELLEDFHLDPDAVVDAARGLRRLHQAARDGDAAETARWIRLGANLEARDAAGETALIRMASDVAANDWREGHGDAARALLRAGAQADATDARGETALHKAARAGNPALTGILLERGADAGWRNNAGRSVLDSFDSGAASGLHSAGLAARAGALLRAAAANADPNAPGRNGWSGMQAAVRDADAAYLRQLLGRGGDANGTTRAGAPFLLAAGRAGAAEIAEILLEYGADANALLDGGNLAHHMAVNGIDAPGAAPDADWADLLEVARVLSGSGIDWNAPDARGHSPLDYFPWRIDSGIVSGDSAGRAAALALADFMLSEGARCSRRPDVDFLHRACAGAAGEGLDEGAIWLATEQRGTVEIAGVMMSADEAGRMGVSSDGDILARYVAESRREGSAGCPACGAPGLPQNPVGRIGADGRSVLLEWAAPAGGGAEGYHAERRFYRTDDADCLAGGYGRWHDAVPATRESAATAATDAANVGEAGRRRCYQYRLRAANENGSGPFTEAFPPGGILVDRTN